MDVLSGGEQEDSSNMSLYVSVYVLLCDLLASEVCKAKLQRDENSHRQRTFRVKVENNLSKGREHSG